MREKKEEKKRKREREREEEKGRESPVTPDEDKTGAWRDGPKAQWGCRYASFYIITTCTPYEVVYSSTDSPTEHTTTTKYTGWDDPKTQFILTETNGITTHLEKSSIHVVSFPDPNTYTPLRRTKPRKLKQQNIKQHKSKVDK